MSIVKLQKNIEKNYSLIEKLKTNIIECEKQLLSEIINCAKITKFFKIKIGDEIDFFYFSHQCTDNLWNIVGIKIDKNLTVQEGEINLTYVKNAEKIESIEPKSFFKYAIKTNIIWDSTSLFNECSFYKPSDNVSEKILPKCVGYCRLSQGRGKHGYQRQDNMIIKRCSYDEYNPVMFFRETLSGDTFFNKRKEIKELIDFCEFNDIKTVYVSEFNRLGRTTDVILDGIKYLRKHGIDRITIVAENITIDEYYITNHYKDLKRLCLKSEEDRTSITNRLINGHKAYIENGGKIGRPIGAVKSSEHFYAKYAKDVELLKQNVSIRKTSLITGTSCSTLQRLRDRMKKDSLIS